MAKTRFCHICTPKTCTYILHSQKDKTRADYLSNKPSISKIEQCLGTKILSTDRRTHKGLRAVCEFFFFSKSKHYIAARARQYLDLCFKNHKKIY